MYIQEKADYCTKVDFDAFISSDFAHLEDTVEDIGRTVDDLDEKMDAIIGEFMEMREMKGRVSVLIPLTIFLGAGIVSLIGIMVSMFI